MDTSPPTCGPGAPEDEYNISQQIGGLFLVLDISLVGCAFPLAAKRWIWLRVPAWLLFACRHLGTGVIITTCFVHLLPTAFVNLYDPCLDSHWTREYDAFPGLIALVAILMIAGVDFALQSKGVEHTHQSQLSELGHADVSPGRLGTSNTEPAWAEPRGEDHDVEQQGRAITKDAKEQLRKTALLESGILCHSVFIGMAIAFSTGRGFWVLLIAISFHQLLEGMALGSSIAAISQFGPRSWKPWLMILAYGLTAPLGQAIGLAVHGSFDLQSQRGLLMVGIANAFSSGLLAWAGLVQLLYEDFFSEHGRIQLRGRRRKLGACSALLVGVVTMSIVGGWA